MVAVGTAVLVGVGEGAAAGMDWARGAVGSAALSDSPPQAMATSAAQVRTARIDMYNKRFIESRLQRNVIIQLYRKVEAKVKSW